MRDHQLGERVDRGNEEDAVEEAKLAVHEAGEIGRGDDVEGLVLCAVDGGAQDVGHEGEGD